MEAMFQPIKPTELQIHEKYKIKGECEYYGTFTAMMFPDAPHYLMFVNVYNVTNRVAVTSKLFVSTCDFYKFVSQKANIQTNMEMRAVNILLRQILGDEHFTW